MCLISWAIMNIKFADTRITDSDIHDAIIEVLNSGNFINGPYATMFEEEFAKLCNARHCAAVNSGSAALTLTLREAKRHMDQPYVIVPSLSFAATSFSVMEAGFTPMYCNVTSSGLMDMDHCEYLLEENEGKIAAVIPVHMYGQLLTLDLSLLQSGALIIEDACQAVGEFTKLQGDIACFSFYPSKTLGAAGDAGAVVTSSNSVYRAVKALSNYGDYPGEKYVHSVFGSNQRISELQAAILVHKLKYDHNTAMVVRRHIASVYSEHDLHTFAVNPSSWYLYPILVDKPDEFIRFSAEEYGIPY